MTKENLYTIPNFLSGYRLLSFPFLLGMIFVGNEGLFTIFICINFITDILDGFIARTFNQKTKFGARLDSLADIGTYVLAFTAIFTFKTEEMADEMWLIWAFLAFYGGTHLFSLIKFKTNPTLHLYSIKLSGYAQGSFLFTLFAFDYYPVYFMIAMGIAFVAWIEELIILILLKEMQADVKGLLWMKSEMMNAVKSRNE